MAENPEDADSRYKSSPHHSDTLCACVCVRAVYGKYHVRLRHAICWTRPSPLSELSSSSATTVADWTEDAGTAMTRAPPSARAQYVALRGSDFHSRSSSSSASTCHSSPPPSLTIKMGVREDALALGWSDRQHADPVRWHRRQLLILLLVGLLLLSSLCVASKSGRLDRLSTRLTSSPYGAKIRDGDGHVPSTASTSNSTVPAVPTRSLCKRTLLYRFAGSHGFASEYLIFLRVALLAQKYGYALFVDDSAWNYGRWTESVFYPHRISWYNDDALGMLVGAILYSWLTALPSPSFLIVLRPEQLL